MPYRVDIPHAGDDVLDTLIELGAMDVERSQHHGLAALMPDSLEPQRLASALGLDDLEVSPVEGRDADSVWILSPRPIRVGRIRIMPAHLDAEPGTLRLIDTRAFGTGLHPTTALCLETIDEAVQVAIPNAVLDVGLGSGVLALAALMMGVPTALGIDIDDEALRTAAENARMNGMEDRLQLARGGPETVPGQWPLVVANVLAAPLIEMAPSLVQRVGHHGRLVLSGIPSSVEDDVHRAYRRLGMHRVDVKSRAGWVALVLQASW